MSVEEVAFVFAVVLVIVCVRFLYLSYKYGRIKVNAYPIRVLSNIEKQQLTELSSHGLFVQNFKSDLSEKVYKIDAGTVFTGMLGLGSPFFFDRRYFLGRSIDGVYRKSYDFKIGSYMFTKHDAIETLHNVINQLKNGDKVSLEFSPNSRYIWKIEKLNTTPVAHSSENKV